MAAVGCSGGGSATTAASPPSPCESVARDVLKATQLYVDSFAIDQKVSSSPSVSPSAASSTAPAGMTPQQYSDLITHARSALATNRCDQARFHDALAAGLPGVRSRGAIAAAVLAQLRVSLTSSLPAAAVTRRVTAHDDLTQALAAVPDGSTLVLDRGTYRLSDTLVLLRPVTLRGAGKTATVLTSGAADAAVLVMTDHPVTLESLDVRRTGTATGSGVVTGPSSLLTLRDVRVEGARSDSQGQGGVGVLLSASAASTQSAVVTFQATRSEFVGNASAGVAAGGGHRTAITSSRFDRNGQCGICYLGLATGSVLQSTFNANSVGIAVGAGAKPVVRDNDVSGGAVGIQVGGSAQPTISGNTIKGVSRASMVFIGSAAGTVNGNNCSGDRTGIAVARSAFPTVKTNACRVSLGA